MSALASQITSLTIVYSTVYSGADQRKHQSSASLAFVRGIHREPVKSPHKGPVTRKMFPFDDVIMLHNQLQGPMLTDAASLTSMVTHTRTHARMLVVLKWKWLQNVTQTFCPHLKYVYMILSV